MSNVIKPIVYVGLIQDGKVLFVDYKVAPNPLKKGWWLPAPGLEYGEDPNKKAKDVVEELGFDSSGLRLHGVESFVLPGGWHLIYHFICQVKGQAKVSENIRAVRWSTFDEISEIEDIAHGRWEAGVAKSYLTTSS